MNVFIYGVFANEEAASNALQHLVDSDFPSEDVRAIMRKGDQSEELKVEGRTSTGRGIAVGAVLGVIGGALVAVGTDLVTSVAWLAAIKGAIVGGAIGTAIGALTGLTFWREEVDFLHRHLKQGSVIVGVETNAGRQSSADEALRAAGAEEVHSRKTELVVNEATSV
ncbi:MAG: hypothetical protein PVH21_05490 [Myxococcales bacterium]